MGEPVPLLVFRGILEPEIGADIHYLDAVVDQRNDLVSAILVWHGGEGEINLPQFGFNSQIQVGQVREDLAQLLPGGTSPGN